MQKAEVFACVKGQSTFQPCLKVHRVPGLSKEEKHVGSDVGLYVFSLHITKNCPFCCKF